jgi:hypothetical protein
LSEENKSWVQESGKWTVFDVSREPMVQAVIGSPLSSVLPVFPVLPAVSKDKVIGVTLRFEKGGVVEAVVGPDELVVNFG